MKRKLSFCAFVFCVFSVFSSESLPFNNSNTPMQGQNVGINSTPFSQFEGYQGGSEYSPFNGSGQNGFNNPILYGPGGEPIGGLPVKNGTQLLFVVVIGYAIFKSVQIRIKKIKR